MEQRLTALEDTVDELQEEVRFLRSEVRSLRRERREAGSGDSLREEQASQGVSRGSDRDSVGSFSVVKPFNEDASRSRSEDPSQGALPSASRSPTPSPTAGARSTTSSRCQLSWLERESICEEIGHYIQRALLGDHRGPSGRDRIQLSSRVWLVFRDYEGLEYRPVRVCRTFGECRDLVKRGQDCGDSVFVGLPSDREACRVTAAAGFDWPSTHNWWTWWMGWTMVGLSWWRLALLWTGRAWFQRSTPLSFSPRRWGCQFSALWSQWWGINAWRRSLTWFGIGSPQRGCCRLSSLSSPPWWRWRAARWFSVGRL